MISTTAMGLSLWRAFGDAVSLIRIGSRVAGGQPAAWPALPRVGRALVLVGVLALLASQWAALVLTGLGAGLPLLTLQPADRPWETWLVLPVAWALTVWAARRLTGQHPMSGATMGRRATVTVRDRA